MSSLMAASPVVSKSAPNQNQSSNPAAETGVRQRPLVSSRYFRPKSRLVEPPYPGKPKLARDSSQISTSSSPSSKLDANTPKESTRTVPITPKTPGPITPRTPLMASPGGEDDEDEDDEVYKTGYLQCEDIKRGKKMQIMILIEWIAFICIVGVLLISVSIPVLRDHSNLWGLQMWKWCVLILVVFCGRLVTEWCSNILVFSIEKNYLLKKKVLYFVYGLKKSVRVFIWLSLILGAWGLLINRGVKRSRETTKILNYITRGIASTLIGSAMWMVKTLLVKLLASSFHVKTFFDRIQESIFHQYVLQTLSGPPMMEYAERIGSTRTSGQLSFKNVQKGRKKEMGEEVIDVDKLYRMKREKVSAWTMGGLINVIRGTQLSTISDALDESVEDEGGEQKEIRSEFEAKAAANRTFKNVAKRGRKYIEEEDLLRFMSKEEVDHVLPLFEGATQTGKIKKASFRIWVLSVYNERKFLAHSLNDTKTAIEELNKIASGFILLVITIVWLLIMEIATTKVLVFISSQLLLLGFVFGNTAKAVFEAMVFVFIMHPFDVGDRCVIDGVQMVVEEMNILTTIFLRYDNEKIYYPNPVLATKPISNFNRSPEMGDSVEFAIDISTSIESIAALKARIQAYLDSKPQHWHPEHSVVVKEIEDLNKMKMALYVTHTINFQCSTERSNRRSDLVLELKKIFEELGIRYRLLPQEVHVSYIGSASSPSTSFSRW